LPLLLLLHLLFWLSFRSEAEESAVAVAVAVVVAFAFAFAFLPVIPSAARNPLPPVLR
jgi:FtsH-binding integral membrane protein